MFIAHFPELIVVFMTLASLGIGVYLLYLVIRALNLRIKLLEQSVR